MEGSQLLLVLRFKLAIEDRLRPEKFVIRQVRVKGQENVSQFMCIYIYIWEKTPDIDKSIEKHSDKQR